jgi:hypothetical protein
MRRIRWLVVLAGLTLGVADLPAQGLLLPGGFTYGGFGLGLRRGRIQGGMAFSFGRSAFGGFGGLGGLGLGPFYALPPQVTVYYSAPPPLLLAPSPRLFLDELDLEVRPRPRPEPPPQPAPRPQPAPQPPPAEPPLAGGDPVGGFNPLAPDNRDRALRPLPAPPEQPKVPEPPKIPEPPPPQPQPKRADGRPELPRPPAPEDDPEAEYARLLNVGRDAFALREYGRARQRFRQATRVAPRQPFGHFLLAQALFALGKYGEAVDAIHAGLTVQPDWPAVPFRPIEMYGPNVTDYPDHLHRLQQAVQQHANDPILLFLYGYELWFDGRKDEARQFFQRALPGGADPGVIDRFLRALPSAPVV